MTTVGFIGLGVMGAPMARHLIEAGHDVVAFNRSIGPVERLVAAGGRAATSVAEASRGAEVVITMLPDGPDVESVSLGADGIYESAESGTLHVDCSTIRPDTARGLARAARQHGLRAIDAPVSGGQAGAEHATLSIMVGGSPADVAAARPILEVVGETIAHVGAEGAGQTVKAANQLMVAGIVELVAEALVFLQAHDVDLAAALDVLGGGLAASRVLEVKAPGMLDGQFEPGFRVDLHHKDMGIVLAAARHAGVATPLGSHVASLLAALRAQGHGDRDHSALMLLVEQLSGRSPA
jgi:2-hydroxy-3-oxopropionate reductase